mgnify:FL=1
MSEFQLPRLFKGHNIFIEGYDLRGQIGDVERPKIALKMEEYRSGGMFGTAKVVQGLEVLEMTVTVSGYAAEVLRQFGGTIDSKVIRFAGAVEKDDETGFKKVSGEAAGRITEIDQGSNSAGENGEIKFKIDLVRYSESLDGKEILYADVLQNKLRVDGKDLYQGFGAALS